MSKLAAIFALGLIVGAIAIDAAPGSVSGRDTPASAIDDIDDMDNRLFYYDPVLNNKNDIDASSARIPMRKNVVFATSLSDLEREASEIAEPKVAPALVNVAPAPKSTAQQVDSIAHNSREVRLVGPDRKEVEMKDDLASKMVVALENLQKEATEVWGTMNVKLDKGWTEFKAMVDEALAPKNKPANSSPSAPSRHLRETPSVKESSLVVPSAGDGYSMADAGNKAESAGEKIKGFLSNIGLNEDNQKKATEALSKAGTSVSETVKEFPDTLKKAGDAVSETFTKDLPNAWKSVFGGGQ